MINKATLHGASARPTTPNHDEETISVITALAGHVQVDISVQEIDEATTLEGDSKKYIDGEQTSTPHIRRVYNVKLFPMTYNSTSPVIFWRADQERAIKTVLASKYLWIDLSNYQSAVDSSITYHAANKAIPVALTSYSHSSGEGLKRIAMTLQKRWRDS